MTKSQTKAILKKYCSKNDELPYFWHPMKIDGHLFASNSFSSIYITNIDADSFGYKEPDEIIHKKVVSYISDLEFVFTNKIKIDISKWQKAETFGKRNFFDQKCIQINNQYIDLEHYNWLLEVCEIKKVKEITLIQHGRVNDELGVFSPKPFVFRFEEITVSIMPLKHRWSILTGTIKI